MAGFIVPTNATIHAAKNFISKNDFFSRATSTANLEFHPKWMYAEPFAIAMIAAWAEWCRDNSIEIHVRNLTKSAGYLWRMGLFNYLSVEYPTSRLEHEEAGRFMPIKRIISNEDVRAAVADISALLHLADNPEDLAAVRFCVSELIRNAIEHSGSPLGAFVCAQNYPKANPPRVSIGIADCGIGVSAHLGRVYTRARDSDAAAIQLALEPGVTGALPGIYGQSDNAGAGLFFTRSIAKGTGGHFLIYSGSACYRIRRTKPDEQILLFPDSFKEPHNLWISNNRWQGTVVAVEIRTDRIPDFGEYLTWIRQQMPKGEQPSRRLRFT